MSVIAGDKIPPWIMPSVSAERMKTMAAVLRDPNPVHWDRNVVESLPLGLGLRTINQGPLGLSYMINMLHAWRGPECIRRVIMRFPQVVLDGEEVIARGTVTSVKTANGVTLAECDIWLAHEERGTLLEGTATIVI